MTAAVAGLSPLARGRPAPGWGRWLVVRTIPARAGTTCAKTPRATPHADYPRSRGDDQATAHRTDVHSGLSPLARGRLPTPTHAAQRPRTIPARAGTTFSERCFRACAVDYPRSRGDDRRGRGSRRRAGGLSPLARGRRRALLHRVGPARTIPARAGTTNDDQSEAGVGPDYPRSRGDDCRTGRRSGDGRGLSPLARGRPSGVVHLDECPRTIPARAGTTRGRGAR